MKTYQIFKNYDFNEVVGEITINEEYIDVISDLNVRIIPAIDHGEVQHFGMVRKRVKEDQPVHGNLASKLFKKKEVNDLNFEISKEDKVKLFGKESVEKMEKTQKMVQNIAREITSAIHELRSQGIDCYFDINTLKIIKKHERNKI